MSVRIRSSPAVNRAAQEWFTGYFNTPVTLTGTFGEGAIGWRSLGTLSHAPVGGSCQVNLGRSGTQWTTRKHDSPQRKVILGLMSTPHSSFPHLQCCMRTFFLSAAGHHWVCVTEVAVYKVSVCFWHQRSMMKAWVTTHIHWYSRHI